MPDRAQICFCIDSFLLEIVRILKDLLERNNKLLLERDNKLIKYLYIMYNSTSMNIKQTISVFCSSF